MRRGSIGRQGWLLLLIFVLMIQPGQAQPKYFNTPAFDPNAIRLTILQPSISNLRALAELRHHGLLKVDSLVVIGVFHQKQELDYLSAMEYARDNNFDWIKFHQISGDLSLATLFHENGCSDDFRMIFQNSDGIIFFGGADAPPYIYRNKTNLLTVIETPYRSYLETSFIFHLLGGSQNPTYQALLNAKPEFPILGICLGCQSLNIGTGGTLIQDIWSEIYGKKYFDDVLKLDKTRWHNNPYDQLYPQENLIHYNLHPIRLLKSSKLVRVLNFSDRDHPYVTSSHHQMAGKLGRGLRVIATSMDGKVVEALEHRQFPNVLGVQFHPEFPILWDRTQKFRFTPTDTSEIALMEILEANPPSWQFHQQIWSWFSDKLKASHFRQNAGPADPPGN
ncbi:MAG: gamma-glutamyl-gamma-aminobutyrate hydrolase family protein [candidate division KSB1 bacterium]|nr:gamma-glutamyl-gamma-aminobutyrate hydrolase family protein [candidate division KSB1 bacterium]